VKCFGGQEVVAGNIIVRQVGSTFHAGEGVGTGKDYTLFALRDGVIKFEKYSRHKVVKTRVHVLPAEA
jgi:large subunit ribosomal protein L27